MSSPITTHVLDVSRGRPASGVPIVLEILRDGAYEEVGRGTTDEDGRLRTLATKIAKATYRIRFDTGAYFHAHGTEGFYPEVSVTFVVRDEASHYHVPLLLSPYGYSTYRGS